MGENRLPVGPQENGEHAVVEDEQEYGQGGALLLQDGQDTKVHHVGVVGPADDQGDEQDGQGLDEPGQQK